MREEIRLLRQWLEAPNDETELDPIIEKILDEPPTKDTFKTRHILECQDTSEDLVRAFQSITRPHKRAWVGRLHVLRDNFLSSNGKPRWIDHFDVPVFFDMKQVPEKPKSYPAWVLSNPRTSKQYFGEWFERSGKRSKDNKFSTTQYRIRKEALEALDRIFGGTHANSCQRH